MHEQPRKRPGIVRTILSIGLLIAAVWIFLNRQTVVDYYSLYTYEPSAEIARLAERSDMSDPGRFYFYASQPQLNDRATFNRNCSSHGEQTVVLGCYSAQRIYVFDVDDERLDGIEEVTASHEMLHAVYERLSRDRREYIDGLITNQLRSVTDPRLLELVNLYDRIEPGERLNELHSIFGTEVRSLSPELEEHYGEYFDDRQQVVGLYEQYAGVFHEMKAQQEYLVAELNALADKINSDTAAYNAAAAELSRDIAAFNARAASGGYSSQAAFDADRDRLLARQSELAVRRDVINADAATYEEKRQVLESINGEVEALNRSINSNALEPQPAL